MLHRARPKIRIALKHPKHIVNVKNRWCSLSSNQSNRLILGYGSRLNSRTPEILHLGEIGAPVVLQNPSEDVYFQERFTKARFLGGLAFGVHHLTPELRKCNLRRISAALRKAKIARRSYHVKEVVSLRREPYRWGYVRWRPRSPPILVLEGRRNPKGLFQSRAPIWACQTRLARLPLALCPVRRALYSRCGQGRLGASAGCFNRFGIPVNLGASHSSSVYRAGRTLSRPTTRCRHGRMLSVSEPKRWTIAAQ